jgi:predicted glycoside hydrolase/deacetylase ChbG (UPF0249 family)
MPELLRSLARGRIDPYAEFRAQVIRIVNAGIRPTHLDTHKHTHLLPPVLEAVARLSSEFGIRWVRRPFDIPLAAGPAPAPVRLVSRCLGVMRGRFGQILAKYGCRTTDHFAGFQLTGRYRTEELVALISRLPEGTTEFMTHPGRCTSELRAARTRLKESREAELRALTDPAVRHALAAAGIRLCGYSAL